MLWWIVTGYIYGVGSALVAFSVVGDDEPMWRKAAAIFGWPFLFPYALLFGR